MVKFHLFRNEEKLFKEGIKAMNYKLVIEF